MMIEAIELAKLQLIERGVAPAYLILCSPMKKILLEEANRIFGTSGIDIREVCGLRIILDKDCPMWTAVVEGKER